MNGKKNRSRKKTPPTNLVGDVFVVASADGLFWNGQMWVPKWQEAQQFAGPLDPSADCQRVADELRSRLGIACNVAYIAPAKVAQR